MWLEFRRVLFRSDRFSRFMVGPVGDFVRYRPSGWRLGSAWKRKYHCYNYNCAWYHPIETCGVPSARFTAKEANIFYFITHNSPALEILPYIVLQSLQSCCRGRLPKSTILLEARKRVEFNLLTSHLKFIDNGYNICPAWTAHTEWHCQYVAHLKSARNMPWQRI